MLTPRKLHRQRQQKEKLYSALRELYADGVRVYTGKLPANEVIRRRMESATSEAAPTFLSTDELADEGRGIDPYNTRD